MQVFRRRRPSGPLFFFSPATQGLAVPEIAKERRAKNRNLAMWVFVLGALAMFLDCGVAQAQQADAATLAERSSIVVLGKVLRTHASNEPLVSPAARTALVSVEKMYSGAEIAGEQAGRIITVILSRPGSVRRGESALFFGNPRFIGRSLAMTDDGELPAQTARSPIGAAQSGAQVRKNKPVLTRLAVASLVFRGTVESVRPLTVEPTAEQEKRSAPRSEHDPEWQVATVRVVTPLRGDRTGQTVNVIFAASRDITWFNSPKLKQGQDAVLLAHAPIKEEEPVYRSSGLEKFLGKEPVYLVTEPFDVLPPTEEEHVRALLATVKETK